MEKLDRHLLENMISNHGFAWVFQQLCDVYEDTDMSTFPHVTIRDLLDHLQEHFEEVENGNRVL